MALRDRFKLGGQQAEASLEEKSRLAGRTAPPTSPVGAKMVQANKDQAKMAGTPAQTGNVLRQAVSPERDLQTQMRQQQVRRMATGEEAEAMERGERLGALEGLSGRVQALTNQMVGQATTQEADSTLRLREGAAADLDEAQRAEFESKLQQLNTDPNNFELLRDINNMLGITTVDNMLTADQLTERFLSADEQAGQLTAEAFQDQVSIADVDPTELGFENQEELAGLLGIPPEELAGLSVRDLIEETEAQIAEEFTDVEDLQRRSQDPNLGPAERAEARKQLREKGAVGVRSAETEIDKLADQLVDADTVEFGGEEMAISDMLEDEYLSGLTARYLQASEDDPFRKQLEESEPELTEWINNNKAVLDEAVQNIESGLTEFAELQYKNQQIAETVDGQTIDDEIMANIYDDWDELKIQEYNTEEVPILDTLNDENADPTTRTNLYSALTTVHEADPDLSKEMATLSMQELSKLGATQNTEKWQNYKQYLQDVQSLKRVDPNDRESVAAALLGPGGTWEELQQVYEQATLRDRSGMFKDSPVKSFWRALDGNSDLSLESPEYMVNTLQSMMTAEGKPRGLKEAIAETPRSISKSMAEAKAYNNERGPVPFAKVSDAFRNDSVMSKAELDNSIPLLSTDEMDAVAASGLHGRMTEEAQKHLYNTYKNKERGRILSEAVGQDRFDKTITARAEPLVTANQGTLDEINQTVSELSTKYAQARQEGKPLKAQLLKEELNEARLGQIAYERHVKQLRMEVPPNPQQVAKSVNTLGRRFHDVLMNAGVFAPAIADAMERFNMNRAGVIKMIADPTRTWGVGGNLQAAGPEGANYILDGLKAARNAISPSEARQALTEFLNTEPLNEHDKRDFRRAIEALTPRQQPRRRI